MGQTIAEAAGQGGSAAWDAEQHKVLDSTMGFDDLVRDARQGPLHIGSGHDLRGLWCIHQATPSSPHGTIIKGDSGYSAVRHHSSGSDSGSG
ncbi:hypothetical protein GCM10009674_00560 [Nesterenkonia xinjiangensis]